MDITNMTRAEVAKMLGCNVRSIQNWVEKEGFPQHQGKTMHPRYDAARVHDWVIEREFRKAGQYRPIPPETRMLAIQRFIEKNFPMYKLTRTDQL